MLSVMQLVPIHILSGWPEQRTPAGQTNLHWLDSLAGVNKIVNWLPVQYNILELWIFLIVLRSNSDCIQYNYSTSLVNSRNRETG